MKHFGFFCEDCIEKNTDFLLNILLSSAKLFTASLVIVDFKPYTADVIVEGWFILPGDNVSRRNINFANDVLHGSDTMHGRGNFVMASYDWPWGWNGSPLTPGITYFFMLTVAADDGRQRVNVYQYKDGVLTQIS